MNLEDLAHSVVEDYIIPQIQLAYLYNIPYIDLTCIKMKNRGIAKIYVNNMYITKIRFSNLSPKMGVLARIIIRKLKYNNISVFLDDYEYDVGSRFSMIISVRNKINV